MKVAAVALALAASAHAKVFFEEKFEKFDTKTWCVWPEEGPRCGFSLALPHGTSLSATGSHPSGSQATWGPGHTHPVIGSQTRCVVLAWLWFSPGLSLASCLRGWVTLARTACVLACVHLSLHFTPHSSASHAPNCGDRAINRATERPSSQLASDTPSIHSSIHPCMHLFNHMCTHGLTGGGQGHRHYR